MIAPTLTSVTITDKSTLHFFSVLADRLGLSPEIAASLALERYIKSSNLWHVVIADLSPPPAPPEPSQKKLANGIHQFTLSDAGRHGNAGEAEITLSLTAEPERRWTMIFGPDALAWLAQRLGSDPNVTGKKIQVSCVNGVPAKLPKLDGLNAALVSLK